MFGKFLEILKTYKCFISFTKKILILTVVAFKIIKKNLIKKEYINHRLNGEFNTMYAKIYI